jgi:hypothetical protein
MPSLATSGRLFAQSCSRSASAELPVRTIQELLDLFRLGEHV